MLRVVCDDGYHIRTPARPGEGVQAVFVSSEHVDRDSAGPRHGSAVGTVMGGHACVPACEMAGTVPAEAAAPLWPRHHAARSSWQWQQWLARPGAACHLVHAPT